MFEKFKNLMPTNQKLCSEVADSVLSTKSTTEIKDNFSNLILQMHDQIYDKYLEAQNSSGQKIIDEEISNTGTVRFDRLDRFLLSVSQSRKSRAGKGFEIIIEELLTRLGYPFSEQVVIEGAKPDYVLPSEDFFRKQPLDSILLTAKRTLRERWRQVVTEANKGYGYFLATIDSDISAKQLEQAATHKIYVVIPEKLKMEISHYSEAYNVITFESFFKDFLDPAMRRWGLEVKEPASPEFDSNQVDLF